MFHLAVAMLLQVRASTVKIQEGGVRLELTVVDTPGFGDVVDNSNWWAHDQKFVLFVFMDQSDCQKEVD